MIEIAVNRFPHHSFKPAPRQGSVAPLAEIWKINHQQNAKRVRIIQEERVINFDVNPQEIEAGLFGESDIFANGFGAASRVDPIREIRLIKRTPKVKRFAIQPQRSWRIEIFPN